MHNWVNDIKTFPLLKNAGIISYSLVFAWFQSTNIKPCEISVCYGLNVIKLMTTDDLLATDCLCCSWLLPLCYNTMREQTFNTEFVSKSVQEICFV